MVEIKSYLKSELAMLYFPDCDPHAAMNRLNTWIKKCRPLTDALAACNQSRFAKYYSAKAVRIIVEYLGEP